MVRGHFRSSRLLEKLTSKSSYIYGVMEGQLAKAFKTPTIKLILADDSEKYC